MKFRLPFRRGARRWEGVGLIFPPFVWFLFALVFNQLFSHTPGFSALSDWVVRFRGVFFGLSGVSLAAGLWIWAWAIWTFMKSRNDIRGFRENPVFFQHGPYARSRHPIYLSLALLLLAATLWHLTLFTLLTWGFFILMADRYIRYEEAHLLEVFGKEYRLYSRRVRRWC